MLIKGREFSEETIVAALKAHCVWPEDVPTLRRSTYKYGGGDAERVLLGITDIRNFRKGLDKAPSDGRVVLSISLKGGVPFNSWSQDTDARHIGSFYSNTKEVT